MSGPRPLSPEFEAASVLGLDDGEPRARRRNRLLSLSDLRRMPMPQPIVSGVIYSDQETVMFGPQGGSKTAVVLDMALHCIHAMPWMGRPTTDGKVVYVCGEGGGKVLANRIDAWLKYHDRKAIGRTDELLRVTEFPVHMLDAQSVDELLDLVAAEGEVLMIVVDTLSANFGGGDENAVADMGKFLDAIRHIRLATHAGLVVVHHTGHHDQTRPQGSNKLRRDVDTELLVNRDARDENLFGLLGGGTLKSRNGVGCGMIGYRLETVELREVDRFGNPLTSIVVVPTEGEPCFELTAPQRQRRGKNQVAALKSLREWAGENGYAEGDKVIVAPSDWQAVYQDAGLNRKQANKVKTSMLEAGVFQFSVGGFAWTPGHD